MIIASHAGITAFKELKTQYMEAVFQMKKQIIAMRQMSLPFFFSSDWMMFSAAWNNGINATSRISAVKGIGGHANHNKNALRSANW